MNLAETEKIINSLLDTFVDSGKLSLDLRKKGLKKELKSDNTPVSNGDLEVNRIVTQKLLELTPKKLVSSEEFSDLFFKKIDEIDDLIVEGENLDGISKNLNINLNCF